MCEHVIKEGEQAIDFEINEESDGTQRIINLLPALTVPLISRGLL